MPTLQIEHRITDFDVWRQAYGRFATARANAGVQTERVYRPIDDPHYVVVDLDFPDTESAQRFLQFLRSDVWSTPAASPALDGRPETRLLRQEV